MSNDLTSSPGRLCNHILRALPASILAKRGNLKFNYGNYYDKMKLLGIDLYTDGINTFNHTEYMNEQYVINLLFNENIPIRFNIDMHSCYCQNDSIANYLYNFYYNNDDNKKNIIEHNKFKERYNTNNNLFIHVRLTDTAKYNQGYEYYEKAISNISYDEGYISSDDINHDICQKLIKNFNLKIIDYDEIETIMFGSTCKNIILTGGSYSFIIGLFGFFSKIYYLKGLNTWYPPSLFYIDNWNEVSI